MTETVERDRGSRIEPPPAQPPSPRHSVRGARVLVGVLALLLLTPTLLSLGGGSDAIENRAPVPFPRLDASTVLDTPAHRQIDAALRDRLTLRKRVVETVGRVGYNGFQTSFNSQVYVGEDGIPFLTDDFTKSCITPLDAAQVDARVRSWEQLARQSGKDVLFAVVPDKSTVMRDKLGREKDALMACADPVHQQSQARWGGDVTGPVLTLWPQFEAAEKAAPGRSFQRGDSHWSFQGSMMFTRAVIDRLVARGDAPAELLGAPGAVQVGDRKMKGDLYGLLGMNRSDKVANWVVRREGVTVTTTRIPTASGRDLRTRTSSAPAGTPLVPGRTLVVYDSFFYNAELQMAPYFQQMTAMHWNDFVPMARSGNLPGFDRVIFESVQRSWSLRTMTQLPEPDITASVTQELSKPASTPHP